MNVFQLDILSSEDARTFVDLLKSELRKFRIPQDPEDLQCPIGFDTMTDPVTAADGHTYERTKIERWLQSNDTSFVTGKTLDHKTLTPKPQFAKFAENTGTFILETDSQ